MQWLQDISAWQVVGLAVALVGVAAVLEVRYGAISGRTEAQGCLGQKACEGGWSLKCPEDVVSTVPSEGRAEDVAGISCPDPAVDCYVVTVPREQMPEVAARAPLGWSPPRVVAGNGEECPVVGLDATARRPLWSHALGRDVELAYIH
ncbi:MAG: hypothetical protein ABEN55_05230, partial [Bradymonadaceae bacterium]